jgi:hypothetical protein
MNFRVFAVGVVVASAASSFAFSTLGTKWDVGGPNKAELLAGNEGTAGTFTWSIMGAGLGMTGFETHGGATTTNFGSLIGGASAVEEIAILNSVFNAWADVCGLVNLGMTADGGVAGGASEGLGGHLGDIRVGLIGGFGGGGVLAHAYQPGTEAVFGAGGTITGDVHVNSAWNWVDDPNEDGTTGTFDLYTVLLHEVGHAIGLGHSSDGGSVMQPFYGGANRTLGADDIAGAQFIYNQQEVVPEPASMAALGLGLAWVARKRKRSKTA